MNIEHWKFLVVANIARVIYFSYMHELYIFRSIYYIKCKHCDMCTDLFETLHENNGSYLVCFIFAIIQ